MPFEINTSRTHYFVKLVIFIRTKSFDLNYLCLAVDSFTICFLVRNLS